MPDHLHHADEDEREASGDDQAAADLFGEAHATPLANAVRVPFSSVSAITVSYTSQLLEKGRSRQSIC
jgi:hypothetical protein